MNETLTKTAEKNVQDILDLVIEHKAPAKALVIYDRQYGLTRILEDAYRVALPDAQYLDYDTVAKEDILAAIDRLSPNDLVVMIQSMNFRLDDFRIRIHLFKQGLRVIEHSRLQRNTPDVWDVYIDSIAYDPSWYRVMGDKVKAKLDAAKEIRYEYKDASLVVKGPFESASLNVGDYSQMENKGGAFPIGEVFTEAVDITSSNGSFYVDMFADTKFEMMEHEPFRVDVKDGIIVGWGENAPDIFREVIETVRSYPERPIIRELGFGLNRAITRERHMQDISAFERILGMHLSIGEKHSVYKKEGISAKAARFHVDVFPVVDRVIVDGEVLFADGEYKV